MKLKIQQEGPMWTVRREIEGNWIIVGSGHDVANALLSFISMNQSLCGLEIEMIEAVVKHKYDDDDEDEIGRGC